MKGKSLLTIGAALVLAAGLVPRSWAQSDGLDVTMRVLDDVGEVTVVIAGIDNAPIVDQPEQQSEERESAESPANEPARAEFPRDELGLRSELDREEDSESEIEDFDVPEDIELPEEELEEDEE